MLLLMPIGKCPAERILRMIVTSLQLVHDECVRPNIVVILRRQKNTASRRRVSDDERPCGGLERTSCGCLNGSFLTRAHALEVELCEAWALGSGDLSDAMTFKEIVR